MTNILQLPQLSGTFAAANNGDWRDALLFVDANNHPLDLTGIAFRQQVRSSVDATEILLDLSTANGLLINGGAAGTLTWRVPAAIMETVAAGSYVADLIAQADGVTVNMFQSAPAAIIVNQGVTCP